MPQSNKVEHQWLTQRVRVLPHEWMVRQMGHQDGPIILFLHGTGADGCSFTRVAQLLGDSMSCFALDLPGHGETKLGRRHRSNVGPMAEDIAQLMGHLNLTPDIVVGHSAGAAISLEMARQAYLRPETLILTLNAAVAKFEGLAGWLFPTLAKLMALNPLTSRLASYQMNEQRVRQLLLSTGSDPTEEMTERYTKLVKNARHVDGALLMMAQWDLTNLMRYLRSICHKVIMLANKGDLTVPAKTSIDTATHLSHAKVQLIEQGGHLFHETEPDIIAELIQTEWRNHGPQH